MAGRVEGKVAIVTGAGHGMGETTACLLAREGARVVVADIKEDLGRKVTDEIVGAGGDARYVQADVTIEADWISVIEHTISAFSSLDVLVNNAGISASAFADNDSVEAWEATMRINATSVFLGTRLAVREMRKYGGGSVVNISSIMGIVGGEHNHPAYHASKAAVRLYTKAAACRYGKDKIRVNSIHPGIMPPMLSSRNSHPVPGSLERVIEDTPLKRTGLPIEVAYGVLYLASDESSFVTGAELVIDGGLTAR